MVRNMASRPKPGKASKASVPRRFRKVTYTLPEPLARKLDERNAHSSRKKSRVVAEALARYFAEQDKDALRSIYEEAAADPLFQEDNAAVQEYFAGLDDRIDRSA